MPFSRLLLAVIEFEGEKPSEKLTAGGSAEGLARSTSFFTGPFP
jgi:hypothetical protein